MMKISKWYEIGPGFLIDLSSIVSIQNFVWEHTKLETEEKGLFGRRTSPVSYEYKISTILTFSNTNQTMMKVTKRSQDSPEEFDREKMLEMHMTERNNLIRALKQYELNPA